MPYRVAVEDIEPNHYVAWLLDLPGCFSSAPTIEAALAHVSKSVAEYLSWLATHDPSLPSVRANDSVEVVDIFHAFPSPTDPEYLVNAFFDDDRRPLTYWDIVGAIHLAQWVQQDMHHLLQRLSFRHLDHLIPNEKRMSVNGIVEHIARAENWYLNHFDLALDWTTLPDNPQAKLARIRHQTCQQLPSLIGNTRTVEDSSEVWSARKMVRRVLWHARDHRQQIERYVASLP